MSERLHDRIKRLSLVHRPENLHMEPESGMFADTFVE